MSEQLNDMLPHGATAGVVGTVGAGMLWGLIKGLFTSASKEALEAVKLKVAAIEAELAQIKDIKDDLAYIRKRLDEIGDKVK
jgi:hypothetical protein